MRNGLASSWLWLQVQLIEMRPDDVGSLILANRSGQLSCGNPATLNPGDSTGGHSDSALSLPRSIFFYWYSFYLYLLQGDFHVPIALQARELLSPLYQ